MKAVAYLVGLVLFLSPVGAVVAAPATLQPHLGVYDLTLSAAREGSGIVSVSGRLVIEITDSCDGYAQTQRMLLRMLDTRGEEILSDSNYTTWESHDGQTIRFNTKNAINGEVSESFSGRAELTGKGRTGQIIFNDPDMPDIELEAGTVFPTEHFFEIINAAISGKKSVSRRIYDGSGPDGVYDTVAVMSRDGTTAEVEGNELLADVSSWRVRLAYFTPNDQAGVPDYEIGFRLYQNGVASDLLLDYGDFSMTAKLSRLDYLPNPC